MPNPPRHPVDDRPGLRFALGFAVAPLVVLAPGVAVFLLAVAAAFAGEGGLAWGLVLVAIVIPGAGAGAGQGVLLSDHFYDAERWTAASAVGWWLAASGALAVAASPAAGTTTSFAVAVMLLAFGQWLVLRWRWPAAQAWGWANAGGWAAGVAAGALSRAILAAAGVSGGAELIWVAVIGLTMGAGSAAVGVTARIRRTWEAPDASRKG